MFTGGEGASYEAHVMPSGPDEVLVLIHEITNQKLLAQALRDAEARFRSLEEQSWFGMVMVQHGSPVYVSPALSATFGYTVDELIAMNLPFALIDEEQRPLLLSLHEGAASVDRGALSPENQRAFRARRKDGAELYIDVFVARTLFKGAPAILCVILDVTSRYNAQRAQRLLQDEMIRMQEKLVEELSTPLIPISDEIVVMPIIGAMDDRRAARMMARLLDGVATSGAEMVILDITGMSAVTAEAAGALVRCAHAAGMLGARVLLTGMRADTARALLEIDVDLQGITTFGTLKAAIAHAMREPRRPRTTPVR
ncbi:PAS domain S-box protein [Sorangium sp. So ce363]|uniref:PAS domain S-box protein n=1 Tax=Sorangium sp. So ce363 TaxID=3133304 RepID=UPI003F627186